MMTFLLICQVVQILLNGLLFYMLNAVFRDLLEERANSYGLSQVIRQLTGLKGEGGGGA